MNSFNSNSVGQNRIRKMPQGARITPFFLGQIISAWFAARSCYNRREYLEARLKEYLAKMPIHPLPPPVLVAISEDGEPITYLNDDYPGHRRLLASQGESVELTEGTDDSALAEQIFAQRYTAEMRSRKAQKAAELEEKASHIFARKRDVESRLMDEKDRRVEDISSELLPETESRDGFDQGEPQVPQIFIAVAALMALFALLVCSEGFVVGSAFANIMGVDLSNIVLSFSDRPFETMQYCVYGIGITLAFIFFSERLARNGRQFWALVSERQIETETGVTKRKIDESSAQITNRAIYLVRSLAFLATIVAGALLIGGIRTQTAKSSGYILDPKLIPGSIILIALGLSLLACYMASLKEKYRIAVEARQEWRVRNIEQGRLVRERRDEISRRLEDDFAVVTEEYNAAMDEQEQNWRETAEEELRLRELVAFEKQDNERATAKMLAALQKDRMYFAYFRSSQQRAYSKSQPTFAE